MEEKINTNKKLINSYNYNKLYELNFYDKLLQYNINRQYAFYNNKYNQIVPNLKILYLDNNFKQKNFNGYKKFYYNNKIINRIIEYDAFYPENFYYIWEILYKFKLISQNMSKFLLVDDNNSKGHLEACIKYCEDIVLSDNINEFIRIPLGINNVTEFDKKFISEYSNHKVYNFTNYNFSDKKWLLSSNIVEQFEYNKFDFIICLLNDILKNIIPLQLIKKNGNMIIYINNFMDISNDNFIISISDMFIDSIIYKAEIQDNLDTSTWIVLKNFKYDNISKSNLLKIINNLGSNITLIENLNIIRKKFFMIYMKNYLELCSKIKYFKKFDDINYNNNNNNYNNICKEWANKYGLILKQYNVNFNIDNYISIILSSNIFNDNIKNVKIHEKFNIYHQNLNQKLNEYIKIISTKEKIVDNNYNDNILDWNKLINCISISKNLKKIISWKFNGEFVTTQWLELYEILAHEKLFENISNDKFISLHLYENTGASIFALNHYIKTHKNIKYFKWYSHCTNYNASFMSKYKLDPENFIHNNNNTQLNLQNIEYYITDKRFYDLDIIICNGLKISNDNKNFIIKMIYYQVYTILRLLPINKHAIFKIFIPLSNSLIISILYLLSCVFKTIKLINSSIGNDDRIDIYCVCIEYLGYNIIPVNIKTRLKYLLNNDINNSIFPQTIIPDTFYNNLKNINDYFCQNKINLLKNSLALRNTYYYDYNIQNELSLAKEIYIKKWIDDNIIKIINESDKIIS